VENGSEMKKIVWLSSLLSVICLLIPSIVWADAVVSIVPAEIQSPAAGKTITVDVKITGVEGLFGYTLKITFDPTAVGFVSAKKSDFLPGAFALDPIVGDNSVEYNVTMLTGNPVTGDGVLATFEFEIVEVKNSTLELSVVLSDASATEILATAESAEITILTAKSEQIKIFQPAQDSVLSKAQIDLVWAIKDIDKLPIEDGDYLTVSLILPDKNDFFELPNPLEAQEGSETISEVDGELLPDGDYTLKLTWFGGNNEKKAESEEITFTIAATPPELGKEDAEITINLSEGEKAYDLNVMFATQEVKVWNAELVSGKDYIEIDLSQGNLTIEPLAADKEDPQDLTRLIGEAEIKITAAKVEGGAEAEAMLTVITENKIPATNRPPIRTDFFPPTSITIGGERLVLDVIDYFSDPDGDLLSWRLENEDEAKEKVSVLVTDSSATITADKPDAEGEVELKFSVSDGNISEEKRVDFSITLMLNQPPTEDEFIIISPKDGDVVSGAFPIEWAYGEDLAGLDVLFKYTHAGETGYLFLLPVALEEGKSTGRIVRETVGGDGRPLPRFPDGVYEIIIEKKDDGDLLDSVRVILDNVPPEVEAIKPITLHLGQFETDTRDLVATGADDIDWQIDDTELSGIATVEIEEEEVRLVITAQKAGQGSFTVTAVAEGRESAPVTVNVIVNTPPVIVAEKFPRLISILMGEIAEMDLSELATDADNEPITWELEPIRTSEFQIDFEEEKFIVNPFGITEKPVTITFTVKDIWADENGGFASQEVLIYIYERLKEQIEIFQPAQDAVLSEPKIDLVWIIEDTEANPIEEGDLIRVNLIPPGLQDFYPILDVKAQANYTTLFDIEGVPIRDGPYTLKLTWFGGNGEKKAESEEITFTIGVTPKLGKKTAEITINLSEKKTYNLNVMFATQEVKIWNAELISGKDYIEINLSQGVLTIIPLAADKEDRQDPTRLIGKAEIKITAAKVKGGAEAEATLTVITENKIPMLAYPLPETTFSFDEGTPGPEIDLSHYITDPDGDMLLWEVSPKETYIATVDLDSESATASFSGKPDKRGTAKFTFTATDSYGAQENLTITLNISLPTKYNFTITSPKDGDVVSGVFPIEWEYSEDLADSDVLFKYTYAGETDFLFPFPVTLKEDQTTGLREWETVGSDGLPKSKFPDGDYLLEIVKKDDGVLLDSVVVILDNVPPEVETIEPIMLHLGQFDTDTRDLVATGADGIRWEIDTTMLSGIAAVEIEEEEARLVITAQKAGEGSFTVTAIDKALEGKSNALYPVSAPVPVEVLVNTPPLIDASKVPRLISIPMEPARIGLLYLEGVAVDADDDHITWEVDPDETPEFKIENFVVRPLAITEKPVPITIIAKDEKGGFDSHEVLIYIYEQLKEQIKIFQPAQDSVLSERQIDLIWAIEDTEDKFIEDGDFIRINLIPPGLKHPFSLPDWLQAKANSATIDNLGGDPLPDGSYTLKLTWVGKDSMEKGESDEISFTIVATPPELNTINAEITINFNEEEKTVNLSEQFGHKEDIEVWNAELVEGDNYIEINTSVLDQGKLTIIPLLADKEDSQDPTRLIGEAEIKITAAKVKGGKEAEATLSVITENKIPVVNQERLVELKEFLHFEEEGVCVLTQGESTDKFNIVELVEDEAVDDLEWSWSPQNNGKIDVYIMDNNQTIKFVALSKAEGTQTVTLTAKDPHGAIVGIELSIRFNQSPRLAEPSPETTLSFDEDTPGPEIDLSQYIIDPDGDMLLWKVSPEETDIATVDLDSDSATASFSGKSDKYGSAEFTFTATDLYKAKDSVPISLTIEPVNDPPKPTGSPLAQRITIGGKPLQLVVTDLFEDSDNDTLNWELEDKESIKDLVSVEITPARETKAASAEITATNSEAPSPLEVKFLVSDGQPDSEPVPFTLTLILNHPPELIGEGTLAVTYLEGGDDWEAYPLTDKIIDSDGEEVLFSLKVPPDLPFEVDFDDTSNSLIFQKKDDDAFGTATITITADDRKGGVDTFPLTVTIEEVNDPPSLLKNPFPKEGILISQGDTKTFNLSLYVVDPDNEDESPTNDDLLEWKVKLTPDTDVVTTELNGSMLIITASEEATGDFRLELTVKDEAAEDRISALVTINSVPTFILPSPLPNPTNNVPLPPDFQVELLEDKSFEINLTDYVEDPDPGDLVDEWKVEPNDLIDIEITKTGIATFTPKLDWHGTTIVTIIAVDEGVEVEGTMEITIIPVPDPPVLKLPKETIKFPEGDSKTVSLLDWAEDDDQGPSELEWQAQESEHLRATVEGFDLTITPNDDDWYGTETIIFTVTDKNQDADGNPDPLTAEGELTVTVSPVGEAPRFLIEEDTLTFQESDDLTPSKGLIKWEDFVEDDDDPVEKLTIQITGQTGYKIQVNETGYDDDGNKAIVFTVEDGDWHGEEEKTFRVTDTEGLSFPLKTYTVDFESTPEAPRLVKEFDTLEMTEDSPETLSLEGYFSDDDTAEKNLQWQVEPSVEHLEIQIDGLEMKITPEDNWNTEELNDGQPQILTLIVTDEEGLETSVDMTVTIAAVDDRHVVEDFTVQFDEDSEHTENLLLHVSDPDLPPGTLVEGLVWKVEEGDENINIDLSDPSKALFYTRKWNWYGMATITLKATDPETGLSDTTMVTVIVTPVNDLPKVTSIHVSDILDDFATREIKFKILDPDEKEKHRVRAFYRLSTEKAPAEDECLLKGADEDGWFAIPQDENIKEKPGQVTLTWFSGIGELADTVNDLIVELEVVDKEGAYAIDEAGTRPQTEPFVLDNTGRVTPLISSVDRLDDGTLNKATGEMGFKIVFERQPQPVPDVWAQFRDSGTEEDWKYAKNAVVRGQGATVDAKGQIYDPFIKNEVETTFFWNVAASGITEAGSHDLRVTPIAPIQGNNPQPVGPSKLVKGIQVTPPAEPKKGITVQLFPPSRIITPGKVGYNDKLDVVFSVPDHDLISEPKTQFQVFDLGGFLIYERDSHQGLSNGWFCYTWDCKTDHGDLAEDGLYIYILAVYGNVKKGTFVIAR